MSVCMCVCVRMELLLVRGYFIRTIAWCAGVCWYVNGFCSGVWHEITLFVWAEHKEVVRVLAMQRKRQPHCFECDGNIVWLACMGERFE